VTAYLVAQIHINDRETYKQYADGFMPIFEKYKGEVLSVDDVCETLEGNWDGNRTVILGFPDKEHLLNWYNSAEYQELMQSRLKASTGNIVIAEGFVSPAS